MRLLSFETGGRASFGIAAGDGVIDAGRRLGSDYPDLGAVLQAGALDRLASLAAAAPDHALADIRYLPPVPAPQKIVCVGMNYPEPEGMDRGDRAPKPTRYPNLFMRSRDSLVGHGDPIVRPPESVQLDYEGELVLVIGKAGRRIPEERALEHVAGATCGNEGTVRDWLRHGTVNITQGKNFDRSGAVGPWLVTLDEIADVNDLRLTTAVNGETRQDDNTGRMTFPIRFLVRYISTFATLQPGDLIFTGTPVGAGAGCKPPRWLQAGDEVAVEVAGIGRLVNRVTDEAV